MTKEERIKHEISDFEQLAKLETPLNAEQRRYLEMCMESCFVAGQKDILEVES